MSNILMKAAAVAGMPLGKNTAVAKDRQKPADGAKEVAILKYRNPTQMRDESQRPLKLENGEKVPFTEEEIREFAGTEYSNGMAVYVYDGEVRDGDRRDGHGMLTYAGGEIFEGMWRMNKRHGSGYLAMTTGHRYEGDWKEDCMDGTGVEQFARGEIYVGDFSKGRMHGHGRVEYASTGTVHTGEWFEGRKHGKGKVTYANGDIFEGTWVHGRREGKGLTTYANGRVYESEWSNGVLVGPLKFLRDAAGHEARQPSRKDRRKLNTSILMPVDLTKWKARPDQKELSIEHFMRIQLAFEKLDVDCSGALSMAELEKIWDKKERKEFAALDRDRNGFVDLYEIYRAWYPRVAKRDIEKYLSTFVTPAELLRHRGELCGTSSGSSKGFVHIADSNGELQQANLKKCKYMIGGERFTENMFKKSNARTDKDTVSFIDVLDVWYPNVPFETLERYELQWIPDEDWEAIRASFEEIAVDGNLIVEHFEAAQHRWQNWVASGGGEPPSVAFMDLPSTPQDALHRIMTEGVFKHEPFWHVGPLTVTLKMLQAIDIQNGGWVSLSDLLCFNYPNLECLYTQAKFLDKPRPRQECSCDIHQLTGDRVLEAFD